MGKTTRVVVCGMKGVGKTAILEQTIYGNYSKDTFLQATIEDIYVALIETERGTKEKVRFYDTAGLESVQQAKHLCQAGQADGYILVYDTARPETFDCLVQLKKEIDKNKEKKEIADVQKNFPVYRIGKVEIEVNANRRKFTSSIKKYLQFGKLVIVILGHNITEVESPIPLESPASKASHWSVREKIKHFEVNALDRSTLYEPFVYLASRLNQPPNKGGFPQLSMVRKSVRLDPS